MLGNLIKMANSEREFNLEHIGKKNFQVDRQIKAMAFESIELGL